MAAENVLPKCTCEAEVHMGVGFYHHPWCATKTMATVEYEPAPDECVDGDGEVWPEHDYPSDGNECRRCGADADDDAVLCECGASTDLLHDCDAADRENEMREG